MEILALERHPPLFPDDLKEEVRNLRKASDTANDPKLNELNEEILSLKQCLADANEELNYCKVRLITKMTFTYFVFRLFPYYYL